MRKSFWNCINKDTSNLEPAFSSDKVWFTWAHARACCSSEVLPHRFARAALFLLDLRFNNQLDSSLQYPGKDFTGDAEDCDPMVVATNCLVPHLKEGGHHHSLSLQQYQHQCPYGQYFRSCPRFRLAEPLHLEHINSLQARYFWQLCAGTAVKRPRPSLRLGPSLQGQVLLRLLTGVFWSALCWTFNLRPIYHGRPISGKNLLTT